MNFNLGSIQISDISPEGYSCFWFFNIPTEVCSAHILGVWTLLAGFFVLVAGYLAYKASLRQAILEEEKQNARCVAYKNLLLNYIHEIMFSATALHIKIKKVDMLGSFKLWLHPIPLPEEFFSQYWENHAILGKNAVGNIIRLRSAHKAYLDFQQEIVNGLRSNELSETVVRDEVETENGLPEYAPTSAIKAYLLVTEDLLSARVNLNNDLVDNIKDITI